MWRDACKAGWWCTLPYPGNAVGNPHAQGCVTGGLPRGGGGLQAG